MRIIKVDIQGDDRRGLGFKLECRFRGNDSFKINVKKSYGQDTII